MNKQDNLINLLKTFLNNQELIEDIDFSNFEDFNLKNSDNLKSFIAENLNDLSNIDILNFFFSSINENSFWRKSINSLINSYQDLKSEMILNDFDYLKYANNMSIIGNNSRVNINELNNNFKLIARGLKFNINSIEAHLFQNSNNNNFLKVFTDTINELIDIWENLLYLWLAFLLKNKHQIQPLIIKQVYFEMNDIIPKNYNVIINENQSININNTNDEDKLNINLLINKLKDYIVEYSNSSLCLIPIISIPKNLSIGRKYPEEWYPGIFFYEPSLNNQLIDSSKKFIYYPFKFDSDKITNENFNPFENNHFVKAGFNKDSEYNLYLGDISYGYKVHYDDFHIIAPFSAIEDTREIIPKMYSSAIKTVVNSDYKWVNSQGKAIIYNLSLSHYDLVKNNYTNGTIKHISEYEVYGDNLWMLQINGRPLIDFSITDTNPPEHLIHFKDINEQYYLGKPFFLRPINKEEKLENIVDKIKNFRSKDTFSFKINTINTIQAEELTLLEDFKNIIYYLPLQAQQIPIDTSDQDYNMLTNNDYLTNSNISIINNNDIDKEALVAYSQNKQDMLEDKFQLTIGEHFKYDNKTHYNLNLIPSEKKYNKIYRYYKKTNNLWDFGQEDISYCNDCVRDTCAILQIPKHFTEDEQSYTIEYPYFRSHTFGTNHLIPLTCIEIMSQMIPDYFSYNKMYRDYSLNRDVFYKILYNNNYENSDDKIENIKEAFKNKADNDAWEIEIVEIISQDTPIMESYFQNSKENEKDIRDFLPPYRESSLSELYQYYQNYGQFLDNKSILLYFSQLAPEYNNSLNIIDDYKVKLKDDYHSIFKELIPNDENDSFYTELAEIFLTSNISKNFISNKNKGYWKKTQSYYTKKEVSYNAIQSSSDQTVRLKIKGDKEKLTTFANHQSWESARLSDASSNYSSTNEHLFKKYYKDKNTDKEYENPVKQYDDFNNMYVCDECLNSFLILFGKTTVEYLLNGFGCNHRIMQANDTIEFEIFGADFPLHEYCNIDREQLSGTQYPYTFKKAIMEEIAPGAGGGLPGDPDYFWRDDTGPTSSYAKEDYQEYWYRNKGNNIYYRWDLDWWNYIGYKYPTSNSLDILYEDTNNHLIQRIPSDFRLTNIADWDYYSYFNPGQKIILGINPAQSSPLEKIYLSTDEVQRSTVVTASIKKFLSPFLHILYYDVKTIKQEEFKKHQIFQTRKRQYPHIYLMSLKTLMPLDYTNNKKKNKKIIYQSYKSSITPEIAKLKDYYSFSGKQLFNNNISKIAYPFPIIKNSTSSEIISGTIKNIVINKIKENMLFSLKTIQEEDKDFNTGKYTALTSLFFSENDFNATAKYRDMEAAFDEIFEENQTAYAMPSPNFSKETEKKTFSIITEPLYNSFNTTTYYTANNELNADIKINYEEECEISSLNLQIIIHRLKPNGQYLRKTLTRVLNENFTAEDTKNIMNSPFLYYNSWTNNWNTTYESWSDNTDQAIYSSGVAAQALWNDWNNNYSVAINTNLTDEETGETYNFEAFPNTGLLQEGYYTEL